MLRVFQNMTAVLLGPVTKGVLLVGLGVLVLVWSDRQAKLPRLIHVTSRLGTRTIFEAWTTNANSVNIVFTNGPVYRNSWGTWPVGIEAGGLVTNLVPW